MSKSDTGQAKSFEASLGELEAIVEAIEQGTIGLEESIGKYEQGMQLIRHCRGILSSAELKIEKLQADAAGKLTSEPFEPQHDAAEPDDAQQ